MRRFALGAAALVGAALSLNSAASTFLRLDIPDLVRGSDRGVYAGRVESLRSTWNPERTMIWTEAVVHSSEDLTGGNGAGQSLLFRVPGGVVDGYRVEMAGAPLFEIGDEIVVFATSWPDGSLMVHGYFQGISSIRLGPQGEEVLAGGSADGMKLAELRRSVRAMREGR